MFKSNLTTCGALNLSLLILVLSCVPTAKQKLEIGGASSASSIGIALPAKDQFRADLRDKLSGYRVIVEPMVDGCNGASVTDKVGAWDKTQITESLRQGCDYSIGMQLGLLDAATQKLTEVYFTNWSGPKKGQMLAKEKFQGMPKIDQAISLTITPEGTAAGFIQGSVVTPGTTDVDIQVMIPEGSSPPVGGGGPQPTVSPADTGNPAGISNLTLLSYEAINTDASTPEGTILRDIVNHIPAGQIGTYKDSDMITWGHETSHGIHAYLRNNKNKTGVKSNGFYLLDGKYAIIREPNIRISQMREFVPAGMRLARYDLYFVSSAGDWDGTPLYIFDEWNAYVNGGATGVDLAKQGKWNGGARDGVVGVIEFNVYALAVGLAVKTLDPNYFNSYPDFKAFLAYNLARGMKVFTEGQQVSQFQGFGQTEYLQKLRTSSDAEALRKFAVETFGASWCMAVLGF
jgi:hypothetical protein